MTTLDTNTSFEAASLAYKAGPPRPFVPATKNGVSLATTATQRAAIKRAAADFEAVFMSSMLENMTAGMKTDKMFGGGHAEEMYRSMLNQEYGKAIAARGSLGIADAVEREMLQIQERSQK
jgi:flagellar protein FlgJ